MQYVVLKDEESGEIEIIGRFKKYGIGEIWQKGGWQSDAVLISNLHDGLLEKISKKEAENLIAKTETRELQAA